MQLGVTESKRNQKEAKGIFKGANRSQRKLKQYKKLKEATGSQRNPAEAIASQHKPTDSNKAAGRWKPKEANARSQRKLEAKGSQQSESWKPKEAEGSQMLSVGPPSEHLSPTLGLLAEQSRAQCSN